MMQENVVRDTRTQNMQHTQFPATPHPQIPTTPHPQIPTTPHPQIPITQRQQQQSHQEIPRAEVSEASVANPTTNLYTTAKTSILLQTARAIISNPNVGERSKNIRLILDLGSQKCYITESLRQKLDLTAVNRETLVVKTFDRCASYE
ncbi:Hypothetical predicted protein [Paramuricea clavata]|uniref:Uncharacterized protein n=2 Tax=Paramuricea clavata TaxID=317549 RepID=A0A6S7H9W5_PARCT|nr:Hypothetical predicted protein [Paramuricea clavata]